MIDRERERERARERERDSTARGVQGRMHFLREHTPGGGGGS